MTIENLNRWRLSNPIQASFHQWKRRWKDKLDVIAMMGGRCVKCGETDMRVLQLNHINGGGRKERLKINHSVNRLYRQIKSGEREISDLNLLCANCNLKYEFERGKRGKWFKFEEDGSYEIIGPSFKDKRYGTGTNHYSARSKS